MEPCVTNSLHYDNEQWLKHIVTVWKETEAGLMEPFKYLIYHKEIFFFKLLCCSSAEPWKQNAVIILAETFAETDKWPPSSKYSPYSPLVWPVSVGLESWDSTVMIGLPLLLFLLNISYLNETITCLWKNTILQCLYQGCPNLTCHIRADLCIIFLLFEELENPCHRSVTPADANWARFRGRT